MSFSVFWHLTVVGILNRTVIVGRWITGGYAKQVQDVGFVLNVMIGAGNLQVSDFNKPPHIASVGVQGSLFVDLLLQQFGLQFLE